MHARCQATFSQQPSHRISRTPVNTNERNKLRIQSWLSAIRTAARSKSFFRAITLIAFGTGIGLGGVGCDIPQRPPLVPEDLESMNLSRLDQIPETIESPEEVFDAPVALAEGQWETWDAYFVGGEAVGWNHVVARPDDASLSGEGLPGDSSRTIDYELENVLYVKQGNALTLQRLSQTSTETADGRLLRFDASLGVGPVVTKFSGEMQDDVLRIQTDRAGKRTSSTIAWQPTYRGLVAIEQSLRAAPMVEKGQKRLLRLLLPGHYQLATARLRCSGLASVPLLDGTLAELNEINYDIKVDDQPASFSTIWTDSAGGIVRTFSPASKLVSYRTDKTTAQAAVRDGREVVVVSASGKFERPNEAVRVAFSVSPNRAALASGKTPSIAPAPGQWIRPKDDNTFQVLVSRKQNEQPGAAFEGFNGEPNEGDSKFNVLVNSNNALVRRLSNAALGTQELSREEIAIELTRTTRNLVSDSPPIGDTELGSRAYGGFVPASDVARDAVGDSTARAILLAALLRVREIPSRIAIGLKYEPSDPVRMVYRSWVIAFVDGAWIHLDPTDGEPAAADRLLLSHTNLAEADPHQSFVPFLDLSTRATIEILGAQY